MSNSIIIKRRTFTNTYSDSNINGKPYNKPCNCPYCNTIIEAVVLHVKGVDSSNGYTVISSNRCTACDKVFTATYVKEKDKNEYKFIYINPTFSDREFSMNIIELSSRFVKLYNQASKAEYDGSYELAGSGYRNALEILIKDYAIKILKEDEEQVKKIKLNNAISKYLNEVDMSKVADVVRILGNDNTHYERKYEDIDFSILKQYLEIFISLIDVQLKINNPPVSR